jgi:hypothetical protein
MGRKKKTNDGENTGNPELKTASEVLSKTEIKPEVKPEEKQEVNANPPMSVDSGVVIETRPITPGELETVRTEEKRDRKRELTVQVLRNIIDDLYGWLSTKNESTLQRYTTADTTDILIDYFTEVSDELYRRLTRFRLVSDRINRLIGGSQTRGFTPRDLERMIFERLAGSIAGTMEQSIEQGRRRRVADEIIRELMEGKEQGEGQGKEGGGTQ